MLTEAVAVSGEQGAGLVEIEPFPAALDYHLGTHQVGCLRAVGRQRTTDVECLRLLRRDVRDLAPLALLLRHSRLLVLWLSLVFVNWLTFLHVEDGRYAQPESRAGHQVRYDALVRLTLVDHSELLLVVDFDADAVFEDVLDVLLAQHGLTVFILRSRHLLEVRRVTPGDLYGCGGLRHVREHPGQQAV